MLSNVMATHQCVMSLPETWLWLVWGSSPCFLGDRFCLWLLVLEKQPCFGPPAPCFGGATLGIGHPGSIKQINEGSSSQLLQKLCVLMLSELQFKEMSWVPKSLDFDRLQTSYAELRVVSQKWLNCRSMLVICASFSLTLLSGSEPGLGHLSGSSCSPVGKGAQGVCWKLGDAIKQFSLTAWN